MQKLPIELFSILQYKLTKHFIIKYSVIFLDQRRKNKIKKILLHLVSGFIHILIRFELDVILCSVSVIPLQHRRCSVCISFVRLGYHNG